MNRSATFIDYENLCLQVERALREDRTRFYSAADCAEATVHLTDCALERVEEQFDLSVIVARAFADWEAINHPNVQQSLALMNVRPMYVLGKRGRSSVDLVLSLAALRLLLTRPEIDSFVFFTGDRSYIPIVSEVLDSGKDVVIASMRSSISGDLLKVLGEDRFFALDALFEPRGGVQPEGDGLRRSEFGLRSSTGDDEAPLPSEDGHLSPENQQRFIDVVERASERYPRGVWLGPFFKNFMNEEFEELNNEERKELVDLARRKKLVQIRYVEDASSVNGGYSVLEFGEAVTVSAGAVEAS